MTSGCKLSTMLEVRVSEAHAELIVDGKLQLSAESVPALITFADRMGDASPLGIVRGTDVAIDLASPAAAECLASFHPSSRGGYADAVSKRWVSEADSSEVSAQVPLSDHIDVNGRPWGWHVTLPGVQAGPTFHLLPSLPPELCLSIELWMAESMAGAHIRVDLFQFGDSAGLACVDDDEDLRWSAVFYGTGANWLQHASEASLKVLDWGPICPAADDSEFEWPPLDQTSASESLGAFFSSCAAGAGWDITIKASRQIDRSTLAGLLQLVYRPCNEHSELYASGKADFSIADHAWAWSTSGWVALD
jgi:hypothetical protein